MSYEKFRKSIDAITAAIGEPKLRQAVASHGAECVRIEVAAARSLSIFDMPWSLWWTDVTPAEFDAGRGRMESTLRQTRSRLSAPPSHAAPWRGTTMCLRGQDMQVEGGGFRLSVGRVFEDSHGKYNRRTGTYDDSWTASLDREFLEAVGKRFTSNKNSTHAKSEEAAIKALRRMAKDYFGVSL